MSGLHAGPGVIANWEAVLRFNRDKLELHLDCMQAHVRT